MLVVGHEATRSGAPVSLLHFLRWMSRNTDCAIQVVLLYGGPLVAEYEQVAPTTVVDLESPVAGPRPFWRAASSVARAARADTARRLRAALGRGDTADLIYLNSLGSLTVLDQLPPGPPVVAHLHEMRVSLRRFMQEPALRASLTRVDRYLAPSSAAREAVLETFPVGPDRVDVCHELVDVGALRGSREQGRQALGLGEDVPLVLAAGTVEWRKGPDLFVQLGLRLRRLMDPVEPVLVWAGGPLRHETETWRVLEAAAGQQDLAADVRLLGAVDDLGDLLAACDVFVLPSREDAFPLVCLEAAALARPIVTLDRGVGSGELLTDGALRTAAYLDVADLARQVAALLVDRQAAAQAGARARSLVSGCDANTVAPRLLRLLTDAVLDARRLNIGDPRRVQVAR